MKILKRLLVVPLFLVSVAAGVVITSQSSAEAQLRGGGTGGLFPGGGGTDPCYCEGCSDIINGFCQRCFGQGRGCEAIPCPYPAPGFPGCIYLCAPKGDPNPGCKGNFRRF